MEALTTALSSDDGGGTESVWQFDMSGLVGKEYVPFVQDVIRMVCIQITIQLLYHLNAPTGTAFFTSDFVMLLVYIVLGVMLYWLVLRKVVVIR